MPMLPKDYVICVKNPVTPFKNVECIYNFYTEETLLHNSFLCLLQLQTMTMSVDFSRRHQTPLVKMTLQLYLKMSSQSLTMHLKHPIQHTVMIHHSGKRKLPD